MNMRAMLLICTILLVPMICNAAPTVTGVSGVVQHNGTITITGSSFGTKSQVTPVAWDNFSQDTVGAAPSTTATIGSWSSVGWKNSGDHSTPFTVTTKNARYPNSRSVVANINEYMEAAFSGGSDSQTWFVQYWFYLGDGFAFNSNESGCLGNIKMFRMWSTGSDSANVRMNNAGTYDIYFTCEYVGGSEDWHPVVSGNNWINILMGHGDPGYVPPTMVGWKNFENDITTGTWHCFQFEYRDSTVNVSDGVIRWWFDGKLILDKRTFLTRNASHTSFKRPKYVGFMNSVGTGSGALFYMTDPYIDNTWARVEIGNASTYNACTHREIQPNTAWANGSITVKVNQGSFSSGASAYLYVVHPDGSVNATGYPITIGSGGSATDPTTPAKPMGISVIVIP